MFAIIVLILTAAQVVLSVVVSPWSLQSVRLGLMSIATYLTYLISVLSLAGGAFCIIRGYGARAAGTIALALSLLLVVYGNQRWVMAQVIVSACMVVFAFTRRSVVPTA